MNLGPAVAGSWYPAGKQALAALVDGLLGAEPEGGATAAIAPHAGFTYSGPLAARAIRAIAQGIIRRVVLVGPSHHFGFEGAAIPDRSRALSTPLGACEIDADAVSMLRSSPGFLARDRIFEPEHALEAELPFLQRAITVPFTIVPVLVGGGGSRDDAATIAGAIEPLLDEGTRLVVSSDFTHYGPRFDYVPFEDRIPERIRELDGGALHAIEAGDAASFADYVDRTGATICGRRAIDVLLRLPVAARGFTTLGYDTSGRMTGTWDHSVSYAAVVAR